MERQRNLANSRERKRMMLINEGFELLKNKLPLIGADHQCDFDGRTDSTQWLIARRCALTKCDILRLAIEYIKYLSDLLGDSRPHRDNQQRFSLSRFKSLSKDSFARQRRPSRVRKTCKRRSGTRLARVLESASISPASEQPASGEFRTCFVIKDGVRSRLIPYLLTCSWRRQQEDNSPMSAMVGSQLWIPELAPQIVR